MGMPPRPMVPPPPRAALSTTVLLTNMPAFLHTNRALRDLIYPCGSARHVAFHPPPPKDSHNNNNNNNTSSSEGDDTNDNKDNKSTFAALVTMSHGDGALKLLCACRQMKTLLLKEASMKTKYSNMGFHLVPAGDPSIPMPPLQIDEKTAALLGERLSQHFVTASSADSNNNKGSSTARSSTAAAGDGGDAMDTDAAAGDSKPEEDESKRLLDVDKLAAAAGGAAYDEDIDPLNTPQVLAAVKAFRSQLDQTQSSQKKRRGQIVEQKVQAAKERLRETVDRERQNPPIMAAPPLPTGVPPPPLLPGGGGPPPLPTGLPPPPPPPPGEKRSLEGTTEGHNKRAKTAAAPPMDPTASFPALPEETTAILRTFMANQIKQYMGEEEATLIDFLYQQVVARATVAKLLQELQPVLEEDAPVFAQELWNKVHELLLL